MFSEYASRFLAQSQSQISNFAGQNENNGERPSRHAIDWQGRGSRLGGRSYLGRQTGSPYQTSTSRFGNFAAFAARYPPQDAPLFQATRETEDEDEEDRDREAADMFALQRSRRVITSSRLEESTETESNGSRGSLDPGQDYGSKTFGGRGQGIKSSWNETKSFYRKSQDEDPTTGERKNLARQDWNENGARARLVDVGLESTCGDSEPPADLTVETPVDDPPTFQSFRSSAKTRGYTPRQATRRESTADSEMGPPPSSSVDTHVPDGEATPPVSDGEMFKHDPFFAWLYLIAQASLFATFVLVFLHTSGKRPPGDTIYTTLRASFNMLAIDTLVSIVVSLVWLAALRSFVRPLVRLILVAVPVILASFALYPFISSYQSTSGGTRLQDWAMRWAAVVPAASAVLWVYLVLKGSHAIESATGILEFSGRILAANSALVLVGMSSLTVVVLWTWAWLLMFTRVFLGGTFSNTLSRFVISASSWWLGIYFVLMYIWTLSIISGVQRGTTAATVSQWYFHRNAQPAPASTDIVAAALSHSLTTVFGTISLSTLLALGIRLPILLLPRRFADILSMLTYSFVPTPVAALTNPLTLTYAAIHSQTLATSSRGLSHMDFISPDRPTSTLTPKAVLSRGSRYSPLLPYRLAKLILHAIRFVMATSLGFAGWVMTARQLNVERSDGLGVKGSAYAYVVGLVASFIGWGILGAMEGVLSGILDAVVICYGSEMRMATGAGGYCMEAAHLFGGRRQAGGN